MVKNQLPMQETQVQSLAWEDSTCHGVTKPVLSEAGHSRVGALPQEKCPQ